ncbi:MAG: [FeFe] hydrogenase H-cluster radical SAM maturase HydE [Marinifilaceae bacterium]|jgi:biotin synthase|nr:[FeFe] hydrogenase H-cluster radical SAM maturase HydE [Marinifilaceae bacterium]
MIHSILKKETLSKEDLIYLLSCSKDEEKILFDHSEKLRINTIGRNVYLRGLIEFSNICTKDCLYCGIRKSNTTIERFQVLKEEIVEAAEFAYKKGYGSIVLQSGERCDELFIDTIDDILKKIKKISNNELGITLSLGEQNKETYQRWFNSGAHRYLLRIEAADENLYNKIHPNDENHLYSRRYECLKYLQDIGYQTGTGVMIGHPFQTIEDLADNLLFFKKFDIDMVGMGPYVEHQDTPLYKYKDTLISQKERLNLSLRMIACLRILMPDINIAAATALQAIDPLGREKAVQIGANVIMPNITPTYKRKLYNLYENKPGGDEGKEEIHQLLIERLKQIDYCVPNDLWGDSKHYFERIKKGD